MPMEYVSVSVQMLDPGAKESGRDFGLALLQMCRVERAQDDVIDSRYWIRHGHFAVKLTEFKEGTGRITQEPDEAFAKAAFALSRVARITNTETWTDPRAGAGLLRAGGAS